MIRITVRRSWADIQIENASWHPKLIQRVKYLFSKVNWHRFHHADFYTQTLALTSKFWDLSDFCVSKATVCRSEAAWGQDVSVPILCSSLDLWVFLLLCLGNKNLLVPGGEVRKAKSSWYFWRKNALMKTHQHKHSVVWLHRSVVPPQIPPTNEDPHLARGEQSFMRTDEANGGRKLVDLPCTDSTTPQGGGNALLSTPAKKQIRRRRWWPTGDCVHCSTCYRTTNQRSQPGSRLSPKPATTRRTFGFWSEVAETIRTHPGSSNFPNRE